MLFYLDEPQIIPSKRARKNKSAVQDDASNYIDYKDGSEESTTPSLPHKMLVSETWAQQEMFGISLALRKKRDWIVHSISEEDATTSGVIVDNPLIGSLPSPTEIRRELEELLSAM